MNNDSIKEFFFSEINLLDKIKKLDKKKVITYICIIISFLIMHIFIGQIIKSTVSATAFTIFWITIFCLIIYIFKYKRLIYLITYYICFIFSIIQYFHINIVKTPFSFGQLLYFKEGMNYTNSIISNINFKIILFVLFGIINSIICSKLIKKHLYKVGKFKLLTNVIIIVVFIPVLLVGKYIISLTFNIGGNGYNIFSASFGNKEIYQKFIDKTQALNITGIYEYSFRDPYIYLKNIFSFDVRESKKIVNSYFEKNDNSSSLNNYTGIFSDKNVIFIMAESIDTWLITEEIMPTVYSMKNNSIDFINRYAPLYGSGRTLNTEYCINTGLYAPVDYNIYSSKNNNYKYSLANTFKNNGYQTNSIHFNNGYFYDRDNMHKAFGYDNSYFLADMTGEYYYNDTDITSNDEFYNLMISKENKFLTFFTTYSAHLPYNNLNELCEDLHDQEECIKRLAKYTDDAIKILIEKLEKDNLLDDTVIVFITDHYTYGYPSEEIEKIKGGSTPAVLDKVPFFIWNNNKYTKIMNEYVDTQDILPTVLNLFGMEYDNVYIGTDAFSNNHKDYVYFNDNSYIGNIGDISIDDIENEKKINDLIVKIDYYK